MTDRRIRAARRFISMTAFSGWTQRRRLVSAEPCADGDGDQSHGIGEVSFAPASPSPPMDFLRRHTALALVALALLLGLAFQGTRGLRDPDEGRYTNVALQVLRSGDWVSLHRHSDSLHFTKPPLTYWTQAA